MSYFLFFTCFRCSLGTLDGPTWSSLKITLLLVSWMQQWLHESWYVNLRTYNADLWDCLVMREQPLIASFSVWHNAGHDSSPEYVVGNINTEPHFPRGYWGGWSVAPMGVNDSSPMVAEEMSRHNPVEDKGVQNLDDQTFNSSVNCWMLCMTWVKPIVLEWYNLSDDLVQLGGYAFAIIQFVKMTLYVVGIVLYNLFKWFCILMGLYCTIYICWTGIFSWYNGVSCVVQFIYVELIYFLGLLEWEDNRVGMVMGGLI